MQIDNGADGSVDEYYSPKIKAVDTAPATLELMTNQQIYHAGDTFNLGVIYDNPGKSLLVDVYISVTNSAGNIFLIPDLSPGHTPLMKNFALP